MCVGERGWLRCEPMRRWWVRVYWHAKLQVSAEWHNIAKRYIELPLVLHVKLKGSRHLIGSTHELTVSECMCYAIKCESLRHPRIELGPHRWQRWILTTELMALRSHVSERESSSHASLVKEQTGIEPATIGSAIPCSTTELLFHTYVWYIYIYVHTCVGVKIRTRNPQIRSLMRYPIAPQGHMYVIKKIYT